MGDAVQSDVNFRPDTASAAAYARATGAAAADTDREHDALLRLLNNCVTAMHLLDGRMADLETKARRAVEDSARERSETRADIATLRTRTKLSDSTIDHLQLRLSAVEAGTLEGTARYTSEMLAARTEIETWRQRAESSIARIAGMESRLSGVETGLERRLLQTESELSQTRDRASRMEQRAVRSEASAADLEERLSVAVSAVADQRARIGCLQAKLGAATQASRYVEHTVAIADPAAPEAIIDLRGLSEERRFSAA